MLLHNTRSGVFSKWKCLLNGCEDLAMRESMETYPMTAAEAGYF